MRNVESGGENVLEDWGGGNCVSRGLDQEPRHALFHEQINDSLTDDLLGFYPEAKDIIRSEAFKHISRGFRFVRIRPQRGSKHLIQVQ